jgi:hypothetical protein
MHAARRGKTFPRTVTYDALLAEVLLHVTGSHMCLDDAAAHFWVSVFRVGQAAVSFEWEASAIVCACVGVRASIWLARAPRQQQEEEDRYNPPTAAASAAPSLARQE